VNERNTAEMGGTLGKPIFQAMTLKSHSK